jgi:trimeric autotransporter adhesin
MANTTYLNIEIPDVGADNNTWGAISNAAFNSFDACLRPTGNGTSVGLNVGSGNTLTVAGTLTASGTVTLPAGATAGGSAVVTLSGSQTLTNKTLTAPVISSITNTGALTLPTSTDTLVGRATTDTLTNKTLTSPTIATPVFSGDPAGTIVGTVYVPSIVNSSNVTSSSAGTFNYLRIGNIITASGVVNITPAITGICIIRVSLPVSSTLSTVSNLAGAGCGNSGGTSQPARVYADTTNNDASVTVVSSDGSPFDLPITFTYRVI